MIGLGLKELLGFLSIFGAVAITIPYCALVIRGTAKPHVFTWMIWSLVMGIAAAARASDGAGPGAWSSWAGCVACGTVAVFALFKGERRITRSDIVSFIAALAAIPVWRFAHDPLLAVVMVSVIDVLGYYPTIRKSYLRPHEEPVFNYTVSNVIQILSFFATGAYSWTTVLYPAVLFGANTILIATILRRRYVLAHVGNG